MFMCAFCQQVFIGFAEILFFVLSVTTAPVQKIKKATPRMEYDDNSVVLKPSDDNLQRPINTWRNPAKLKTMTPSLFSNGFFIFVI